jgi:type 1 glutamine amidotransferase
MRSRTAPAIAVSALCSLLAIALRVPSQETLGAQGSRAGGGQAGLNDAASGQDVARGRGGDLPRKKRVLAWADTRNGQAQHDSVGHALATIERLGYDSGTWDTFIRTDSNIISRTPKKTDGTPASGGPSLSNIDAIFFEGHREVALDATQKEELLQFVREGHGFVAAHVGLTAFESWPEFGELIGARFDGHPISGDAVVINENRDFPASRHFPGTFTFNDEFYQPKLFSRDKIDVLLRLDVKPGDPRVHPDGDYPLAWAKTYGKGRVFFSSFAHASATWDNHDVQQMYFEAMRWTLGLTNAEPAPHPLRGSGKNPAPIPHSHPQP